MDNAIYYHVAYVVAAVVLAGYTASIRWRDRDLSRREAAARRGAAADGADARERR
jgi:hypothetical protein